MKKPDQLAALKKTISYIIIVAVCITSSIHHTYMPKINIRYVFTGMDLNRTVAEKKNINSFLFGYFDQFGISNFTNQEIK